MVRCSECNERARRTVRGKSRSPWSRTRRYSDDHLEREARIRERLVAREQAVPRDGPFHSRFGAWIDLPYTPESAVANDEDMPMDTPARPMLQEVLGLIGDDLVGAERLLLQHVTTARRIRRPRTRTSLRRELRQIEEALRKAKETVRDSSFTASAVLAYVGIEIEELDKILKVSEERAKTGDALVGVAKCKLRDRERPPNAPMRYLLMGCADVYWTFAAENWELLRAAPTEPMPSPDPRYDALARRVLEDLRIDNGGDPSWTIRKVWKEYVQGWRDHWDGNRTWRGK